MLGYISGLETTLTATSPSIRKKMAKMSCRADKCRNSCIVPILHTIDYSRIAMYFALVVKLNPADCKHIVPFIRPATLIFTYEMTKAAASGLAAV